MNQSSQRIWCYKCEMEVFIVDHGYSDNKIRFQAADTDDHSNAETSRYVNNVHF